MLFIHNDVVRKVLTMKDCIAAQEHAFRQIPTGGAVQRARIDMYVPCERDDGYYRCFQETEQLVRTRLTDGRRHAHEMALKDRRRSAGHPAHTASPSDESAKGESL